MYTIKNFLAAIYRFYTYFIYSDFLHIFTHYNLIFFIILLFSLYKLYSSNTF